MRQRTEAPPMLAVPVRVRPGVIVWRHGAAHTHPHVVQVTPDDAQRLVSRGSAERVRT